MSVPGTKPSTETALASKSSTALDEYRNLLLATTTVLTKSDCVDVKLSTAPLSRRNMQTGTAQSCFGTLSNCDMSDVSGILDQGPVSDAGVSGFCIFKLCIFTSLQKLCFDFPQIPFNENLAFKVKMHR